MVKIENVDVYGFESAIRGMRNSWNSLDESDSVFGIRYKTWEKIGVIGFNDLALMKRLIKAGSSERKFLRFIGVTCDIVAPLYWWKEFDTYKVGTVRNSCSTMHTIAKKEFTLDDFSHEHLLECGFNNNLLYVIQCLNAWREKYIETKDKNYWWQMIQLLPSSYNQRATVQLNYEVLMKMYHERKNHRLDEWKDFCKWIVQLPYMEELLNDE